jgi:hypothetical protein
MVFAMDKRSYKSQFEYAGINADDAPLSISERDLLIFRLLDPEYGFHYLPSNWIHAFVGGDAQRVSKRLGRLAREPHAYLVRRQARYKHAVYARTAKADAYLGEPLVRDRDPFAHRLLQDLVLASFALAVSRDPILTFVPWLELAASGKIPAATLNSAEPHAIALQSGKIVPDGKPFAIRAGNRWRFVLGMEIDRGTEPLTSPQARRSIAKKLENYAECFSRNLYASHYGFPNSVVLFVTTSAARMKSMMALTERVIGPCSYLLFAHTTDWAIAPSFPPPGDILGPMQRVGHPPLELTNFGDT